MGRIAAAWWMILVCGVVLVRATDEGSSWRTVSSSGKRYLSVHNNNSNSSAETEGTDKSVHNVPIATNYYPSRKEPTPSVGEPGDPVVHNPAQPTRYHYYPHNQHVYLLPECAIQQVCNAVYVRLNFTQPLCACPLGHRDPCSASLRTDDLHTTELVTDPRGTALTLVKTCEPVSEMRECRAPRDWSLLALQNVRTGKSHYLVICRCPSDNSLEGPMSHDQPTYASVPGIRVFGMMCVRQTVTKFRSSRPLRMTRAVQPLLGPRPLFPWHRARQFASSLGWTVNRD